MQEERVKWWTIGPDEGQQGSTMSCILLSSSGIHTHVSDVFNFKGALCSFGEEILRKERCLNKLNNRTLFVFWG